MTSIQNNTTSYSETVTHHGALAFKMSYEASSSGGTTKAQINLKSIAEGHLDLSDVSKSLGQFTELSAATIEKKLNDIRLLPKASGNPLIEVKIAAKPMRSKLFEKFRRKNPSSNEKMTIKIKPAFTPRPSSKVKKALLNGKITGDGLTWHEKHDEVTGRFFEAERADGTFLKSDGEPPTGASKVEYLRG